MRVFCDYNQDFDRFLKTVVEYVMEKYSENLDLRNVEEIELVREVKNSPTDGRFSESRIVVTERLFKMLPTLDISKLKGNGVFEEIVGALYHEMGHATDSVRMPALYSRVFNGRCDELENWAIKAFLEFVAERRTRFIGTEEYDIYCESIKSALWNVYENNYPNDAFFNCTMLFVYFIIKTDVKRNRNQFLGDDSSKLLLEYANVLEEALLAVYNQLPFNEIEKCIPIADVMRKYMPLFEQAYAK